MRYAILSLLVAGMLGLPCTSGAASEMVPEFESAGWNGFATYDDGEFTGCGMFRADGWKLLRIDLNIDGNLVIAIADANWDLGQSRFAVTFQVDDAAPRRLEGPSNQDLILFLLDWDWELLNDLRSGDTLYVRGEQPFEFPLSGAYVAMYTAMQCVIEHARAAGLSNPFPASVSVADPSSDALTAEDIESLRVLLVSAGFEDVPIVGGQAVQDETANGTLAVWGDGDSILGSLRIIGHEPSSDPRRVANNVLRGMGTECPDELKLTQDTPVQAGDATLLRVSASCAFAVKSLYYDVFFHFEPRGALIITHFSEDSARAGAAAATRELVNIFRR